MRFNFNSGLASVLMYIFIVCVLPKDILERGRISFKNVCFLIPLYKTFAITTLNSKINMNRCVYDSSNNLFCYF